MAQPIGGPAGASEQGGAPSSPAHAPSPGDPEPTRFATWQGEDLDVGDVTEALDRLRGRHRRAATRTSVLNLVVVSANPDEVRQAAATMRALNAAHPGRTVVVDCAPGRPARIDATVSLFESIAEGEQVWWEEVRLRVAGPVCSHLRSLVEPLMLADLPRVAWFVTGVPSIDEEVLGGADVVVVDTEATAEGQASSSEALWSAKALAGNRPVVVDLAWLRVRPWREGLARLFETPDLRGFLDLLDAARVRGLSVQRRLLAGWLAERSGLDPGLVRREAASETAVELYASREGHRARFLVGPEGAVLRSRAILDGDLRATSGAALPDDPLAWSVSEALSRLSPDELYTAALALAARD